MQFFHYIRSIYYRHTSYKLASQVALAVKNPPAKAGGIRDMGSIPGSGRPLGERHGNPLWCSFLENPMDRGAWRATVHGVSESDLTEVTKQTHSQSIDYCEFNP